MKTIELTKVLGLIAAKPAIQTALRHLAQGREIAILVEGQFAHALFYDSQRMRLEARAAYRPDITINLSPTAIHVLHKQPGLELLPFLSEFLKLVGEQQIHVKVTANPWRWLSGGYLKILPMHAYAQVKARVTRLRP